MPRITDAQRFLRAAFGDVPAGQWFTLWTLPDKISRWYRPDQLADAARFAEKEAGRRDVYVGAGLSSSERDQRRRQKADEVSGIVGLWADVDYVHTEAHKKSNLPPDQDAARTVISAAGVEPTIVVASGHGLQAWWLFAEAWLFDTSAERGEAATLANRWNLTLKVRAAEHGWTLDSTFDLARVMRMPGSTNYKAEPVPVTIAGIDLARRYQPSDFEDLLVDDAALGMLGGRRTYHVGELRLDPKAEPPFDKLDALRSNDKRFNATWERTRTDLKDDSPSAWDLSLTTQAAAAGWTDQELADLMVASRRKHGDDLKLRHDYYARTIAKCRDDAARQTSSEEIETATERVEQAEALGDQGGAVHARKQLVDHVSQVLGVEVLRFVRYTQDPPRYRMETPLGAVTLGGASAILEQRKMRERVADATRIVIPRFKAPKWDSIAQAIFKACEDEDTGIESTDAGTAFAWIVEYLQDRPVLRSLDEAVVTSTPYEHEGQIYVFGPALRRWLHLSRADRVDAKRMGEVLRAGDCEHQVVNVTIRGSRSTRSVWRVGAAADLAWRATTQAAPPDEAQEPL